MLKSKCLVDRIKELQTENEEMHQKLSDMTELCERQENVIQQCTVKIAESTIAIVENYETAGKLATALVEIYEKIGDEN